jgi:hypothetical protein
MVDSIIFDHVHHFKHHLLRIEHLERIAVLQSFSQEPTLLLRRHLLFFNASYFAFHRPTSLYSL